MGMFLSLSRRALSIGFPLRRPAPDPPVALQGSTAPSYLLCPMPTLPPFSLETLAMLVLVHGFASLLNDRTHAAPCSVLAGPRGVRRLKSEFRAPILTRASVLSRLR